MSKKFIVVFINSNNIIKCCNVTCPYSIPNRALFIEPYTGDFSLSYRNLVLEYYLSFNNKEHILEVGEKYKNCSLKSNLELTDTREIKNTHSEIIEESKKTFDAPKLELESGRVVYLIDEGFHVGVILNVGTELSYMLMITGNNLWNNKSRLISKDEFGLLGMPQKKEFIFCSGLSIQ